MPKGISGYGGGGAKVPKTKGKPRKKDKRK